MDRLKNKVAIVTGSGSGIGKEIALTYAKEGAKIVVADFNEEGVQQTVKELNALGTEAIGVKVNVINEEDISKMVDETVKQFGTVDILVNNAGVSDNMQAATNVTDETWERVMNINVTGVMRTMRKVLPIFQEKGNGNIVNMASISGLTGGRGGLSYTASKHAVVGMTKNVASQYGPQNIRCNAIGPAHVPTPLTENMENIDKFGMEAATRGVSLMKKAGTTQEIANIALFLASEESTARYKYIH
ncbi:glucose 1-dehydrogenase [Bacillus wiedmannii]|uniref:glucose 1-dehydrogenase n=1 Tax=Bacillus wiedmannii TaxID=1890302 RepID=UPI003D952D8F